MKSLNKTPITFLLTLVVFVPVLLEAAALSVSGNARFGTQLFQELDLQDGTLANAGDTSSYMDYRILLRPEVVIDSRFSVKTELNLLSRANTMVLNPLGQPYLNNGAVLGSDTPAANELDLTQAYFQWSSDYGLFQFGRMPKSWGMGLLYDGGQEVTSAASTVVDRASFKAQLASLSIGLAFEKYQEGADIHADFDDSENYEATIEYVNSELLLNIGLLYSRNIRSAGSSLAAAGFTSSHDFSFYVKKSWEDFFIGTEFSSIAFDDTPDVMGALARAEWKPGRWNLGVDFAYASEKDGRAFVIHQNYRPMMILYSEALGAQLPGSYHSSMGVGGDVVGASGSNDLSGGLGAYFTKFTVGHSFDSEETLHLALDVAYAKTVEKVNGSSDLGLEFDLNFNQQWFENFKTTYTAGVLLPGDAFGSDPKMAWGLALGGYLEF